MLLHTGTHTHTHTGTHTHTHTHGGCLLVHAHTLPCLLGETDSVHAIKGFLHHSQVIKAPHTHAHIRTHTHRARVQRVRNASRVAAVTVSSGGIPQPHHDQQPAGVHGSASFCFRAQRERFTDEADAIITPHTRKLLFWQLEKEAAWQKHIGDSIWGIMLNELTKPQSVTLLFFFLWKPESSGLRPNANFSSVLTQPPSSTVTHRPNWFSHPLRYRLPLSSLPFLPSHQSHGG